MIFFIQKFHKLWRLKPFGLKLNGRGDENMFNIWIVSDMGAWSDNKILSYQQVSIFDNDPADTKKK